MQGLVLQLTRAGFLMLLWVFIWSVLRILRTDIYAPTGAVMVRRGLALRSTLLPSRQRRQHRHRPRSRAQLNRRFADSNRRSDWNSYRSRHLRPVKVCTVGRS